MSVAADSPATSGRSPSRPRRRFAAAEAWFYLAPGISIVALVMLVPLAVGISFSFQNYVIFRPMSRGWNGVENYIDLWTDRTFWLALANTARWTFWSVAFQLGLGLGLALILNKPFPGRAVFQSLVFLPWAVPTFLSGLNWQWLFNPIVSPLPAWLTAVGVLDAPRNILSDPDLALYGPITAMIWWGVPFFAITLLAALRSIPQDLYEAASIDGASAWQSFRHITVPFLMPMITITILLRTVWVANSPDLIFVMTEGGPANSSQTLPNYVFTSAYKSMDFGYASALATVLMVLLVMYSVLLLFIRGRLGQ
ncbi:Lactose transport system permease protein LacF [Jannaschia seosinensis]|uniref:Lactose transport system permease protein LacF n=1 Tax=Jannaschia seosinensis TaxID=313367 RepID=A0A0M7BEB5_9RHOB|nr:sugar ABC transporter permease [Jannaschia seosinensis]CUH40233.1 Lactose transport system permease protein LacF [Jannaschia seosinensis]